MAPKAAFLRISLRALIVLSTIITLCVGKVAIDARNQKNAVARIRQLGGHVTYDWQEPIVAASGTRILPTGPSGPQWLRSLVGDEYFQKVIFVDYSGGSFDTTIVEDLPHLRNASFVECDIKDLTPFARLTELQYLSVRGNQIADLSPLVTLQQLEFLDLSNNQIVDCTPLHNLKTLRQLELQGNPIDHQQFNMLESALPDTGKTWSQPE